MKKAISFLIIATCLNAQATIKSKKRDSEESKTAKICQALFDEAQETCSDEMVRECKENGGEDCENFEGDGDFAEGLQICVQDSELPFLLERYNKKNGTNIDCSDY